MVSRRGVISMAPWRKPPTARATDGAAIEAIGGPPARQTGQRGSPLPPDRPRNALERADDPTGDPAAVEAAGLCNDLLAVDGAAFNQRGHHRDRSDRLETRGGVEVAPRGFGATRVVVTRS